jgi:hypothetical protein
MVGCRRASTNSYNGVNALAPKTLDRTYLQEHLPKNTISFFPEDRREYDSNTVMRGLNIYRFFVAIVDLH